MTDKFLEVDCSYRPPHHRHVNGKAFGVKGHFFCKPGLLPSVFPEDRCFDGDYFKRKGGGFTQSESLEHIESKRYIATEVVNFFYPNDFKPIVKIEHIIKTELGKKRIIDVAYCLPDGTIEAHEAQLCSITPDELEERTLDYDSQDISVMWWFGGAADTQPNREWYYDRFKESPHILSFSSSKQQSSLSLFPGELSDGIDEEQDSPDL